MPGGREPPKEPAFVQHQHDTEKAERERQQHAENTAAINAVAAQLATNQDRQNASDSDKAFREKLTIRLLVATVAVTLATLIASEINAYIQHRDASHALHAAYVAMHKQDEATAKALARADNANKISQLAADKAHGDNVAALQAARDANADARTTARIQEGLTTQSNVINKQAFTATQRAFMVATGIDFEAIPPIGNVKNYAWAAHLNWSNSGATPTVNLIVKTDCFATSAPVDDPYHVPDSKALVPGKSRISQSDGRYVFGPHQSSHAGGCITVPALDIAFGQFGYRSHDYIAGRAEYRDVFTPSSVHITEFCFQQTGYTLSGDKDRPTLSAFTSLCPVHNCADQECSKEDRTQAAHDLAELR
jgi:hypothetical protein